VQTRRYDANFPVYWPQFNEIRAQIGRLCPLVNESNCTPIKFTAKGHVTLTVTAGDDRVTVSVQDTGLGIPTDEQKIIFDEFRQSERTAAR